MHAGGPNSLSNSKPLNYRQQSSLYTSYRFFIRWILPECGCIIYKKGTKLLHRGMYLSLTRPSLIEGVWLSVPQRRGLITSLYLQLKNISTIPTAVTIYSYIWYFEHTMWNQHHLLSKLLPSLIVTVYMIIPSIQMLIMKNIVNFSLFNSMDLPQGLLETQWLGILYWKTIHSNMKPLQIWLRIISLTLEFIYCHSHSNSVIQHGLTHSIDFSSIFASK